MISGSLVSNRVLDILVIEMLYVTNLCNGSSVSERLVGFEHTTTG